MDKCQWISIFNIKNRLSGNGFPESLLQKLSWVNLRRKDLSANLLIQEHCAWGRRTDRHIF